MEPTTRLSQKMLGIFLQLFIFFLATFYFSRNFLFKGHLHVFLYFTSNIFGNEFSIFTIMRYIRSRVTYQTAMQSKRLAVSPGTRHSRAKCLGRWCVKAESKIVDVNSDAGLDQICYQYSDVSKNNSGAIVQKKEANFEHFGSGSFRPTL